MRRLRAITPLLVSILACAQGGQEGNAQMGSGARLVRELTIGAPDGARALTEPADLLVGADGAIYVALPQEFSIRVFSRTGASLRTIGRRGGGPGEFRSVNDLAWRADTLVASDHNSFRISAFHTSGRNLFTYSFATLGNHRPRALLAGGRVLFSPVSLAEEVASGRVTTEILSTADRNGRGMQPVVRLAMNEHTARVRMGSGGDAPQVFFPQPFATNDLYDVDPRGRWLTTVTRAPRSSRNDTAVVTRRAPNGSVLWTARIALAPRPLPRTAVDDTVQAYISQFQRAFPDLPPAAINRLVRPALHVPSRYPPVVAIVAGQDGTTWLRRGGGGSSVQWIVVDGTGRVVRNVTADAGLRILATDRERVWGVVHDEDDVPYIVQYRMVASS